MAAGAAGLGREVTWATRIRASPPAFGHLAGGELVLVPVSVLAELDERLQLERLSPIGRLGRRRGRPGPSANRRGKPLTPPTCRCLPCQGDRRWCAGAGCGAADY